MQMSRRALTNQRGQMHGEENFHSFLVFPCHTSDGRKNDLKFALLIFSTMQREENFPLWRWFRQKFFNLRSGYLGAAGQDLPKCIDNRVPSQKNIRRNHASF